MSPVVRRHPIDKNSEIGTVIEIVAANEILIRLSPARMLGDDHPRHYLEQLTPP